MSTLGEITTKAAALLNDSAQAIFTFATLKPFAQKAFEEMVLELDSNHVTVEFKVSASIPVPLSANPSVLTLPTDFLYPERLEERMADTSDGYDRMVEKSFETNIIGTTSIRYWAWYGDQIHFPPCTQNREVLLYYVKFFTTPDVEIDPIMVDNRVKLYLEARTAAIAAALILQDEGRSSALNDDAVNWLDKVIRVMVRNKQGIAARRLPYGSRYRTRSRITIS